MASEMAWRPRADYAFNRLPRVADRQGGCGLLSSRSEEGGGLDGALLVDSAGRDGRMVVGTLRGGDSVCAGAGCSWFILGAGLSCREGLTFATSRRAGTPSS